MTHVYCIRREGPKAVYQHDKALVLCEHVRTVEPWDVFTQQRTKVKVTELDASGRLTGRSVTLPTSSYDEAALYALQAGDARVVHNC